jgi:sec-independent protein translocase protein TatA
MNLLFGIFGVGPMEILVVGGIVLLLFGNRLPGAMRSLGRGIIEFKRGAQGIEDDGPDDSKTTKGNPSS